jgi:hypothetical protein
MASKFVIGDKVDQPFSNHAEGTVVAVFTDSTGVKLTGYGYQSESAAQFAGRRALTELLAGLAKEERRRS